MTTQGKQSWMPNWWWAFNLSSINILF